MTAPVPDDHPGLHNPGQPGARRYLCPFCSWYFDEPIATLPVGGLAIELAWTAAFAEPGAFVAALHAPTERAIEEHLATHVEEMVDG